MFHENSWYKVISGNKKSVNFTFKLFFEGFGARLRVGSSGSLIRLSVQGFFFILFSIERSQTGRNHFNCILNWFQVWFVQSKHYFLHKLRLIVDVARWIKNEWFFFNEQERVLSISFLRVSPYVFRPIFNRVYYLTAIIQRNCHLLNQIA